MNPDQNKFIARQYTDNTHAAMHRLADTQTRIDNLMASLVKEYGSDELASIEFGKRAAYRDLADRRNRLIQEIIMYTNLAMLYYKASEFYD